MLESLRKSCASLELDTGSLCFLAALALQAEHSGVHCFDEDTLVDLFEQSQGGAAGEASSRGRATATIRKLRAQRLLVRVDAAGLTRKGEYSLSRLATAIVDFYLDDETLTRESLALIMASLRHALERVHDAAVRGGDDVHWQREITSPLEVTLRELASGIERRQRGFDLQQEDFQREIAELLGSDWFGAVERCGELLDAASTTLRELNDVLLGEGQRVAEALHAVLELAEGAGQLDSERAARSLAEQLERIASWGASRQRTWSDYHQWVHRYLRDVVRLDPSRTLVHRLREQLAGRRGKPYALVVAAAPAMRLLRPHAPRVEPPPARRPKRERERAIQPVTAEDREALLEASVRELLAEGVRGLADLVARLGEGLSESERFALAGRTAAVLARLARVRAHGERAWLAAGESLWLEEWPVEELRAAP